MTIRRTSTLALAGCFAFALTGSAFAQVGGGTEMPSSTKQAVPSSQSGSPANKASNGGMGAMKGGAMKGGAMKGGSMKGGAMKGGAMKGGAMKSGGSMKK